jgi:hypothetical protein
MDKRAAMKEVERIDKVIKDWRRSIRRLMVQGQHLTRALKEMDASWSNDDPRFRYIDEDSRREIDAACRYVEALDRWSDSAAKERHAAFFGDRRSYFDESRDHIVATEKDLKSCRH